jgi:hypothetical protein
VTANTGFPDFLTAGKVTVSPDLYDIDNRAMDPAGLVVEAMRSFAPPRQPFMHLADTSRPPPSTAFLEDVVNRVLASSGPA